MLDPGRVSARVTREISSRLAEVARDLEGAGHDPEGVAGFLSRCLFCMFAEDVGLLPKRAFTELLESFLLPSPSGGGAGGEGATSQSSQPSFPHPGPLPGGEGDVQQFIPLLAALWREMDTGGFSVVLRRNLPRFNGKLFKTPHVLPLDRVQIGHLPQAAKSDWTQVEPAIFGTLLERALNPLARHALGAHYTPRAYVERLVLPTVIDPLDQLGDSQGRLEAEGLSVDPHQFLGLEVNPRAAASMRAVLGDGYVEALRGVWKDVPESADFVMVWWRHAAGLARGGRIRRFGFITTNSIRQTFNRRVIEVALNPPAGSPDAACGIRGSAAAPEKPWIPQGSIQATLTPASSLRLLFAIPRPPLGG